MSVVRIPPVLRVATGGAKNVDVPGSTVGEVIDGLVAAYPGLGVAFVNVFLNDIDIRHLQKLDTPAADRDSVIVMPAMAGGSCGLLRPGVRGGA